MRVDRFFIKRLKYVFRVGTRCFLLSTVFFIFWGCSGNADLPPNIVAQVGDKYISVEDFKIAYELYPVFNTDQKLTILDRKKIQLRSLIEKQLLVTAAALEKADQIPRVKKLLTWYKAQAAVRALYRKTVRSRVEVLEPEKRLAFKYLQSKLSLRQLFFTDSTQAGEAYSLLQAGRTFEQVAQKYNHQPDKLKYIMTPKIYTWGDLDSVLEMAAFKLRVGKSSSPVRTASGYHILQLVNKKSNMLHTEFDYQNRENYIRTIIRRRREGKLARVFARKMMAEIHPVLDPQVFDRFNRAVAHSLKEVKAKNIPGHVQIAMIRPNVTDFIDNVIIHFKNGGWTIRQLLEEIASLNPTQPFDLTDRSRLPLRLSVLVRDHFLAKKALDMRLDKDSIAVHEYDRDSDNVLALYKQKSLIANVVVDSLRAKDYYDAHKELFSEPPTVHVREIFVREKKIADSLYAMVRAGEDMAKLARRFSIRKWAALKGGDLGYMSAGRFSETGKMAFQLKTGELSNVFPQKDAKGIITGYAFISILDKKTSKQMAYADCKDLVNKKVLEQKRQAVLDRFFLSQKSTTIIRKNMKILEKISTTDKGIKSKTLKIDNLHRF